MKKAIIALLAVVAFLGGAVGGEMLGKGRAGASVDHDEGTAPATGEEEGNLPAPGEATSTSDPPPGEDWFRFPNQFFIPIMRNGTTSAVMVLSLTLEMSSVSAQKIAEREHRLRDALLNALMIEANTGGFDGNFTSEASLGRLRKSLLAAARKAGGPEIASVLIEDIARQEQ
ncbi:hypothetical protein [Paracoccus sp. KR1-242]|uniref:hypothetical protein n=1 Tax=Paracoccus sp. KR1-242 TaxID=3410028 RepID=UPI003C0A50F8